MLEARRTTGWVLTGTNAVLTVVIAVWWFRESGTFLGETLGLNEQALRIPWAWLVALAAAIGCAVFAARLMPLINEYKLELSRLKLIAVWTAVVSGIFEELVFRKKLMDLFESWAVPVVWQVMLSGLVFGSAHAVGVLLQGEFSIAVPIVTAATFLGMMLACAYVLADRNVLPAVAGNMLLHLLIEPWMRLAVISGYWGARPVTTVGQTVVDESRRK